MNPCPFLWVNVVTRSIALPMITAFMSRPSIFLLLKQSFKLHADISRVFYTMKIKQQDPDFQIRAANNSLFLHTCIVFPSCSSSVWILMAPCNWFHHHISVFRRPLLFLFRRYCPINGRYIQYRRRHLLLEQKESFVASMDTVGSFCRNRHYGRDQQFFHLPF